MQDVIEKYFKLLYDSLRFPVEVIDENGRIIYVNNEFNIQWGYNIAELKEYNVFKDPELRRNGVLQTITEVLENKV
jgi:PAS domain S-box-containing protein